MKKRQISLILSITLILAVSLLLVSVPIYAQEETNDDSGDTEIREERKVEVRDDGEIRIRERREIRGPDGERIRERIEIRERTELTDSERSEILRSEHRLRIDSENSEVPENCERRGVVLRCELEDGSREMTVHTQSGNTIVIQSGDTNASTNVTLYHHDGRVFGSFGDNDTREVILPDEVKLRVRERVRAQIEDDNLTLTEDGEYILEARKRARLFGILEVRERVSANVDAETGEILRTRNPWWGFLAFDVPEEDTETQIEAEA